MLRYGGQLKSQRSRKVPEAAPLSADGCRLSQPRPYALLLGGGSGPRAIGPEADYAFVPGPSYQPADHYRDSQATARAFVGADEKDIKYAGKWSTAAYLKYVRERRAESLRIAALACGADVDDFENEFLAIEQDPVSLVIADSSDGD